jgi:N-acetylmuramoyl-L-alanine amidase
MSLIAPDHTLALMCPSPNFGLRKDGKTICAIILHYTGMETGIAAQDWLCNPQSQVSSHYLIHENGQIIQMVAESSRAWHAGKSYWFGETDINSLSIGIEIVNKGHVLGYKKFPKSQISSVIKLCQDIIIRYDIPPAMVLAHSDIAPERKVDPGELFPWRTLYQHGVGVYVAPIPITSGLLLQKGDENAAVRELQTLLQHFGFDSITTGVFDDSTYKNVTAFQRHHRVQKIDGIADVSTVNTLKALLDIT